jgi:hypothetical protein
MVTEPLKAASQPMIGQQPQQKSQSDQRNSSLSSQGSVDSFKTPKIIHQPFCLQVCLGDDQEMMRGYQSTFALMQQAVMKLLLKVSNRS